MLKLPQSERIVGEIQFYHLPSYSDGKSIDLVAIARDTDAAEPQVNAESHCVVVCDNCGESITAVEFFHN